MIGVGVKIKEIMTTDVITVKPDDPMEKVRDIFEHYNIHHVPVALKGKVVGMISREDYFRIIQGFSLYNTPKSEEYNNAILRSLLAGEVMVKQVARLGPDDSLQAAAGYFRENLFHAIPVVDKDDTLVGIITTYDLINFAFREGFFE